MPVLFKCPDCLCLFSDASHLSTRKVSENLKKICSRNKIILLELKRHSYRKETISKNSTLKSSVQQLLCQDIYATFAYKSTNPTHMDREVWWPLNPFPAEWAEDGKAAEAMGGSVIPQTDRASEMLVSMM